MRARCFSGATLLLVSACGSSYGWPLPWEPLRDAGVDVSEPELTLQDASIGSPGGRWSWGSCDLALGAEMLHGPDPRHGNVQWRPLSDGDGVEVQCDVKGAWLTLRVPRSGPASGTLTTLYGLEGTGTGKGACKVDVALPDTPDGSVWPDTSDGGVGGSFRCEPIAPTPDLLLTPRGAFILQ